MGRLAVYSLQHRFPCRNSGLDTKNTYQVVGVLKKLLASADMADKFDVEEIQFGRTLWDVPFGPKYELKGKSDVVIVPKGTAPESFATCMLVSCVALVHCNSFMYHSYRPSRIRSQFRPYP